MNKQTYWWIGGLGILIILFGGFVFYILYNFAEFKEVMKEQIKDIEKKEAETVEVEKRKDTQHIVTGNPPPPPPRPAKEDFAWEWHGDHWYEVRITANQSLEEEQQAKSTRDGPLTYHGELLQKNPVKALRLQAEERGHWSAKWILPFPPDDHEAANLAKCRYLIEYYKSTGERTNNPALKEVERIENIFLESLKEKYLPAHEQAARYSDLLKLTWPSLDTPINHCE